MTSEAVHDAKPQVLKRQFRRFVAFLAATTKIARKTAGEADESLQDWAQRLRERFDAYLDLPTEEEGICICTCIDATAADCLLCKDRASMALWYDANDVQQCLADVLSAVGIVPLTVEEALRGFRVVPVETVDSHVRMEVSVFTLTGRHYAVVAEGDDFAPLFCNHFQDSKWRLSGRAVQALVERDLSYPCAITNFVCTYNGWVVQALARLLNLGDPAMPESEEAPVAQTCHMDAPLLGDLFMIFRIRTARASKVPVASASVRIITVRNGEVKEEVMVATGQNLLSLPGAVAGCRFVVGIEGPMTLLVNAEDAGCALDGFEDFTFEQVKSVTVLSQ